MARGRRASAASLSVAQILNEAQRGAASAHVRYAKMLWELAERDIAAAATGGGGAAASVGIADQLLIAMKHFATVAEPTVYQSRLLNFFGTWASETGSEERVVFVEALLEPLLELSRAKDPTPRWRFCQLLHALVGNLPAEAELSEGALDAFEAAMLERLEDGKPTVRAVAVRALARLLDPGPAGDFSACDLTRTLVDMLAAEKGAAVRKAVLATLQWSDHTYRFYLERTRDVVDDVRKMAYLAIAERVPLAALPAVDAALLVRRGLGERSAAVRDAVASKLVMAWLDSCDGEPLRLVHALNVLEHPEECEMVLQTLLERGEMNAVYLAGLAESDSMGLRVDFASGGALMGPASALFWRVVCEWLQAQATSRGLSAAHKVGQAANIDTAAAGQALDALEQALPPTVADMADIIARHAAAGAAYRFSCGQLMQLAAKCMDFADAAGHGAAAGMLRDLLSAVPSGDDAEEAAAWEAAWHSEAWLRALALFLRKVYGSPAELADAMLGLLGTLCAAAGIGGGGPAPEQAWVHVLGVAGLLLEQLTSARPAMAAAATFTLPDLLGRVIVPALDHRSAKVRCEGVRCLGLYCFLDGITERSSQLLELRRIMTSPDEPAAVRAVAVQALGDIAVAHSVKDVDRCFAAAAAASLAPGQRREEELAARPLVELFLDQLHCWIDDFAAAARTRRRAARRSGGGEALEGEAALGAALVEALARLVRGHLRWTAREEVEGRELAMDDMEVVKVLVELSLLHFNVDVEGASLVCQALPVFFQNYAELTPEHQQFLATALLPAARTAAREDADMLGGKKVTAAACTASKVMGFLGQLLVTPYGPAGKQEPVGHEMLVDVLLQELHNCCARFQAPAPYLASLCRVASALEVFPVGEAEGGVSARVLLELGRQAFALVPDAAMRRQLQVLLDRLHARAEQYGLSAEPLAPEEIGALMERIRGYDGEDTILADFRLPFDAKEEGAPPGASGRAAKTPARGGRRTAAAADSSDEEESDDGGPQMPSDSEGEEDGGRTPSRVPATASRRLPDRAARSARKPVVEAASSSEEEGSDEEEEEEEDALSPLAENASPAVRRPNKARRQSSDSVSALRQALQENRIS